VNVRIYARQAVCCPKKKNPEFFSAPISFAAA
jgi:hypothetical protein